jgi:cyclase
MDTVASLYGRNNLEEIVSRAAEHIYIPLTVGGGIRSVEDMRSLLRAGADKIAINTAAINNPSLITDGARVFGSQCIVVSIEAKKRDKNKYECLTDNGREKTGVDAFEWARRVVDLGAGEILLTSVDREGAGKGYDIELTATIAEAVNIPVIACGGAGDRSHVAEVVQEGKADAVSAASIFHYGLLEYMVQKGEYKEEGNIVFLKKSLSEKAVGRKGISPISLRELKSYLSESGINCRL